MERKHTYEEILQELQPLVLKQKEEPVTFTKKVYSHQTKNTDWQVAREAYPKCYEAYVPPPPSTLIKSTYYRLGPYEETPDRWISETHDVQQKLERDYAVFIKYSDAPKKEINFINYETTEMKRKTIDENEILPKLPREMLKMDYTTTFNRAFKWVSIPRPKTDCNHSNH